MVSTASCHESYSLLVSYHVLSSSVDMGVIVVVTESCATLVMLSISIDIGVIVALTGFSLTSMLIRPSVSSVLFRDTSHGSVLFQILSSSGCAASNSLTLVTGQIWCSVILVMLDSKTCPCPKNYYTPCAFLR